MQAPYHHPQVSAKWPEQPTKSWCRAVPAPGSTRGGSRRQRWKCVHRRPDRNRGIGTIAVIELVTAITRTAAAATMPAFRSRAPAVDAHM